MNQDGKERSKKKGNETVQPNIFIEPEQQIPCFGTYDVAVVGGGFAGVAAALSAARNGAQVCLIEKCCALGGLGTLGLVVDYLPLCDGNGTKMIGGIGEELMRKVSALDGSQPPDCWLHDDTTEHRSKARYQTTYNPGAMILMMEELLLEAGVELYYDTRFSRLMKSGKRIQRLIVENKSGRGWIGCKTVIDASGDADVCHAAGEKTVNRKTNVCAWWFYTQEDGDIKLHRNSDNFYIPPKEARLYSGVEHEDVSSLCIETRDRIRAYLRESAPGEGAPLKQPLLLPVIPQFRMTRRLSGLAELDVKDCHHWLDTCIGMTGDWRKRGPRYCVPFSAICAEEHENLLAAGRCMAVSDEAWDITRVIPVCAVTGEAAGTAAALAVKSYDGNIKNIEIRKLQEQLRKQGVILDRELFTEK